MDKWTNGQIRLFQCFFWGLISLLEILYTKEKFFNQDENHLATTLINYLPIFSARLEILVFKNKSL